MKNFNHSSPEELTEPVALLFRSYIYVGEKQALQNSIPQLRNLRDWTKSHVRVPLSPLECLVEVMRELKQQG